MKIENLLVVGVGLIGGSLALALKRAGVVGRVVGCGRRVAGLEQAMRLGVIDAYDTDLPAAAARADVIFLGVPVGAMARLLESMAPVLAEGVVVTDGGSTKRGPLSAARAALGAAFSRFVPGHPIAGSERSGVSAARADLYDSHKVLLTPETGTARDAIERVEWMWRQAGAVVESMDAGEHDRVLGITSHLPHVLAYALVDFIARSPDATRCFDLAAGGFIDFTRIASSDPVMWRDISIDNADTLASSLDRFIDALVVIRQMIEQGRGDDIEQLYRSAREARERLIDKRGGV
jgi:prephenate dehydrogenase